ncbi:hypothetical protein [Streptomyces muensis]|uniref:Uncharacterized protein n=1 Tax=Streptomyces muensis TaxID=1077944 RepID=A0A9X1PT10_STRM4|nr:hypothetical protein [Streptomyces muensis]MCF1592927.1 hypothetical protein [Streptomyces muensis]
MGEVVSDTFLVAARIPMSRDGFEAWLSTPIPDVSRIANPAEMFDGWCWNGERADREWDSVDGGITPREFFSQAIEKACFSASQDGCLVLYREGALEAYLFHFGYKQWNVHTALLMFAGAGEFKSETDEDTVLFWAETGGNLWDADDTGWLAVLSVGKGEARFVSERDLTNTVAGLRPVESRFFDMIERLGEEEESWDWESGRDFRTDTPRDGAFVDPAVLEHPGPR